MNTEFFEKASDLSQDFTWKDIFSEVFRPHTKEQRNRLLTRGIGDNVPAPGRMLKEWQKPWLFFKAALIALALSALALLCWSYVSTTTILAFLFVFPAFAIPLAVLVFYWEMNIPGDISIFETLLIMLGGGLLSILLALLIRTFVSFPNVAYLAGPLPEEIAKFVVVWLILSRGKYRYGIQGILIGGAVGAGFAAIESAGYAFNVFSSIQLEGTIDAVMQNAGSEVYAEVTRTAADSMLQLQIVRGLLSLGGHTVWAAMYGGALALTKKGEKLTIHSLAEPLVWMAFSAAFLLHTVWNFSAVDLLGIFAQNIVEFLYRLDRMYLSYLLWIVLAWMFLLFVMRKCIRQIVAVSTYSSAASAEKNRGSAAARPAEGAVLLTVTATGKLNHGQVYELRRGGHITFGRDPGKANAVVPADTKGVSGLHCEIKEKEGYPVLIDRNSSYGTFFSNGKKLEPNVPYKIKGQVKFYLAKEENQFLIKLK